MDGKIRKEGGAGMEIFLVAVFFIALIGFSAAYLVDFSDGYQESLPQPSETRRLITMVKGSIYESGETMSVFGTCVDAYSVAVVNSSAVFSAWYPNGTQFINGTNMTKLAEGYFIYEGSMSVVKGTYLTEMTCTAFLSGVNQTAKAWGEWQNPFWVERIGNLSEQMEVGFNNTIANITFLQENMTNNFNVTNQLILETQVIANGSVDRNNSLLADLLYELLNWTDFSDPYCVNATLNTTIFSVDEVIYWSNWTIEVKAYGASSNLLSSPDVVCFVNTTLTPAQTYMDVEDAYFTYTEFISSLDDFYWNTSCFCT